MNDFIVFGEDWGRHPSSTQHLFRHIMKEHRVIWINSIGLRNPKFSINDCKRIFHKGLNAFYRNKKTFNIEHHPNLTIVNPKVIPFHGIKLVRLINKYLLRQSIKKLCKKYKIKHPYLWISLPTAVDMVGSLHEKLCIYYCCDDFSALTGVDHKMVEPLEKALGKKVDVIFVTNEKLKEKFDYKKTFMLPHGVDYDMFSRPTPIPKELNFKNKIAGFYGSISSWLDIDLIEETVKLMHDWNFIFIGSIHTNVERLKKIHNVYFLGPKKHYELPAYVQHFDVAMLPFKNTEQIKACNPLKLREYLASGTAIASTDFPAAQEYKDCIEIREKGETFKQVLIRALQGHEKRDKRKNSVIHESWAARVALIKKLIEI